jgi:hypothetical protein
VEGIVPAVLASGGATPTPDAPWWRFHALWQRVADDLPGRLPRVRAAWDAFEATVEARRQDVEARAARQGPDVLSAFMQANVEAMTRRLEALLAELA